jgi:hypothetical protein
MSFAYIAQVPRLRAAWIIKREPDAECESALNIVLAPPGTGGPDPGSKHSSPLLG